MRKNSLMSLTVLTTVMLSLLYSCYPRQGATLSGNIDTVPTRQNFPVDWYGKWQGMLQVYTAGGLAQEVPMYLQIGPGMTDSLHQWTIAYLSESGDDIRAYSLVAADTIGYHYQIDEKNSILIDSYRIHDRLISVFEVMGSTLQFTYTTKPDKIHIDVAMSTAQPLTTTGDTIIRGDTIPAVHSYKVGVAQSAVLLPVAAD